MENTLKFFNEWRCEGKFSINLFVVSWVLGRKQLAIAVQNLIYWVKMYERDESRMPMRVGGKYQANESTYVYLFKKFPELEAHLICSDGVVDYKKNVVLERRLELARYVKSLPVLLKF